MVKNEPVEQAITEKSVSSNNEIAEIKDLKDIRKKLFHRAMHRFFKTHAY